MRRPSRLVLLGHPVSHSRSPAIQNAALDAAGISLRYEGLDVVPGKLAATLKLLRDESAAGNVTIPHKSAAFDLMDDCMPTAQRCGAVNTFWTDGGHLIGDNTDVEGFARFAERMIGRAPAGLHFGVLGAGGAAAAVLAAIEQWPGCRATVVARNAARSLALVRRFSDVADTGRMSQDALATLDIVVNATPVGLAGDEHPAPIEWLNGQSILLDLVYRPGETPWVRAARASGHRAADGQAMLVEQGAAAFRRWFGIEADRGVMWAALREEADAVPEV